MPFNNALPFKAVDRPSFLFILVACGWFRAQIFILAVICFLLHGFYSPSSLLTTLQD